jgi:hypothetical protein
MRPGAKKILGAMVGAAALTTALVSPAHADPAATPALANIVGVGSATTQYLVDKYTKSFPSTWNSWNAVPAGSTITPSVGCAAITRPNGSSAGLTALATYGSGTSTNGCIDFARSSRGPKTTTAKTYAFFAFGRDGVTWASWGATGAPVPASLTTAQLKGIYQASNGVAGGPCTTTNWNQVGGANAAIKKAIPQIGSGTRDFFLATLGVTALCAGVATFNENDGVSLATALGGKVTNGIAPYSIGDFIAQRNAATTGVPDTRNSLILRNVNGTTPCAGSTNCATAGQTLNPSFSAAFLRLIYNVVKTSDAVGTVIAPYLAKFGTVAQGGVICKNPALITTFGFASLGAACGIKTLGGPTP